MRRIFKMLLLLLVVSLPVVLFVFDNRRIMKEDTDQNQVIYDQSSSGQMVRYNLKPVE